MNVDSTDTYFNWVTKVYSELNNTDIVKTYLKFTYARIAHYNAPLDYALSKIFNAINEASGPNATDALDSVLAGIASIKESGLVAMSTNRKGEFYDVYAGEYLTSSPTDTRI